MDNRKVKILNTIIKSYIDSKEPVGSRNLSKYGDIGYSAATIRNEMSDLEDLGYLKKLHTSSGRVPSNIGYRYYVDALLSDQIPFERGPNQLFDMRKIHESGEFDNVIKNATKILSEITNYTAFALLPETEKIFLKYINIVQLGPKDLMVIYIYNSKEVFSDSIRLKHPIDRMTIDLVNSLLTSTLVDLNNKDVLEALHSRVYDVLRLQHHVLDEIIPVVEKTIYNNSRPRMVYEGLSNIFVYNQEEMSENRRIVHKIKDENPFTKLLLDSMDTDLQVYIGDEIGYEEFQNFSIVSMTFRNSEGVKGKIGVLGPNSMRYDKVISDIILISKYINGHIERR